KCAGSNSGSFEEASSRNEGIFHPILSGLWAGRTEATEQDLSRPVILIGGLPARGNGMQDPMQLKFSGFEWPDVLSRGHSQALLLTINIACPILCWQSTGEN
ncbi:MAG TPA: hypothetical protein VJV96_11105, partial [Candidatus Angelobacter sp.]|nr:hypothetical protein [Candidatus Angelobacter sp.]